MEVFFEKRWLAPEEQHPRLISGLQIYTNTHASAHTWTSTPLHTEKTAMPLSMALLTLSRKHSKELFKCLWQRLTQLWPRHRESCKAFILKCIPDLASLICLWVPGQVCLCVMCPCVWACLYGCLIAYPLFLLHKGCQNSHHPYISNIIQLNSMYWFSFCLWPEYFGNSFTTEWQESNMWWVWGCTPWGKLISGFQTSQGNTVRPLSNLSS